ncbi:MFS transporter [Ideonella sp. A 288]|uniref:MFS transporter n=1 Tax=Ideonella sp. A 288 TaxID=1962181 RepID=UPI000B4AD639|nr:MFS transporter [Ideonella sp. A 288]
MPADAPTVADEPPYAWVVVWATFACLAVIFGVSYSFAAYFESFTTEFTAQRADVSLVFGLSGLIYFVLGAGAGILADRFGPRAVICAGMVCIAGGLLACSFASSMAMVIAAYGAGVGVGIAMVYTPSIACVQPWFTKRRGLAAGLASAGIGAGTLVVPLLATAAIGAMQWRGALRLMAAGVLVLGLGAALLMRRAPAATAVGSRAVAGFTLGEALRTPSFRWMYLMAVLASPGMFIPFAHLSAAARDLGIDDARAVGLVGMIGIGSLTGRFVIGGLADRIGRPLTLVMAQASLGLAFLLWWGAGGYLALALFALWMGLSYGGIVSLMPALCMDLFGARAVASIIGALYTAAALGNLAGPWVAGWVFDRSGSYTPVVLGCLLLQLAATLLAAKVLPPRRAAVG